MPQLNNNQYTSLAGNEDDNENGDDQENDSKITGVDNYREITGVDVRINVVD